MAWTVEHLLASVLAGEGTCLVAGNKELLNFVALRDGSGQGSPVLGR